MSSNISESSTSDEEIIIEEPKLHLNKIINTLEKIISRNESSEMFEKIKHRQKKNLFNSFEIPEISFEDYLKRVVNYSQIQKATLIISLIYIDRFCSLGKIFLTRNNIHKIFFICAYLSIKFNEDVHFRIKYFSDISGMEIEEILMLEYEFLRLIQYNLFVDEATFHSYSKYLEI